ncbi:hypothetical protein BKA70DRAFT_1231582 [Coprinopsis sp. MPI-PUGE-AT-0042]|nr:hypothetical protein BKA70DRAFT_1231582 [Coprinopsis sp. MPI-PUGE-AT-0042]
MNLNDLVDTPACRSSFRSRMLPQILKATKHPLHPSINPGRTFIALIRGTETYLEEMKRYEDGMGVPLGLRPELGSQGLVEMTPGDYLFARDTTGTGQPEDDTLLAWAVGPNSSGMYDDTELNDLEEATIQAIGNDDSRSPGSTHFESLPETTPVQTGSRCYTLAQSFEAIPAIVAPCASGKWKGNATEYITIVRNLIKIAEVYEVDLPSGDVQYEMCYIFDSGHHPGAVRYARLASYRERRQLRISDDPVQHSVSGEDVQRDERDSVGHFTNIIANSKLPPHYDPGCFHLLLLGVYVSLQSGIGFNFQGHWKHGGSAPTCPSGGDFDPFATRFVLVSYPPLGMVSDQVRHRFAELPRPDGKNDAIYVTPEMKVIDSIIRRPHRRANFMSDGHIIMEPRSYAGAISKLLYNEIRFQINQSPSYIGLHIDPSKFFESLSFEAPSGHRKTVDEWDFAVESRHGGPHAVAKRSLHVTAEERWRDHVSKTAKVVPYSFSRVAAAKQRIGDNDDDVAMNEGGTISTEPKQSQEQIQAIPPNEGEPRSKGKDPEDRGTSREASSCQQSHPAATRSSKVDTRKAINQDLASDHNTAQTVNGSSGGKEATNSKVHGGDHASTSEIESIKAGNGKGKSVDKKGDKKRKREDVNDGRPQEQPNKRQDLQRKDLKFASLLTASILETEVHQLRRSTDSTFQWDVILDGADALAEAGATLDRSPFDLNALHTALTIVQGWKTMEEMQSSIWLDGYVRTSVIDRLNGMPTDAGFNFSWIARLADAVGIVYTTRTAAKTFNPSDFGIASHMEGISLQPYTLANNCRGCYPPCGDELAKAVGASVVLVVSNWMGGYSDIEQKRAWFVDAIAEHLGEEALTLDLTWNMVRNFKPVYVLPREQAYKRHNDDSLLEPFLSTLRDHPTVDPGTREGKLYRLYRDVINKRKSLLDITDHLLDLSHLSHPGQPTFKVDIPGSLAHLNGGVSWDTVWPPCPGILGHCPGYLPQCPSYFYRKSDIVAIQTLGQCPGIPTWDTVLGYRPGALSLDTVLEYLPGTLSWDTDLGHCPWTLSSNTYLGHCPGTPTWDTVPKARTVS